MPNWLKNIFSDKREMVVTFRSRKEAFDAIRHIYNAHPDLGSNWQSVVERQQKRNKQHSCEEAA